MDDFSTHHATCGTVLLKKINTVSPSTLRCSLLTPVTVPLSSMPRYNDPFFGIGQRHHVVHELIVNLRSGCLACKLNRQAFMVQQHKFTHIDTVP